MSKNDSSSWQPATAFIHGGIESDPATGAVMTPIYQTSTYEQAGPGVHKGFEYSRTQNPTRQTLENALAVAEGGAHGVAYASGMAAIDAVIKLLRPGDEIVSSNDLYGGTYRMFTGLYEQFGLHFKFVDMADPAQVEAAITENTKMLWVETPTNPLLKLIDIEKMVSLARQHGLLTAVDNTFATPYLQLPLSWGADLVVQSLTKYIAGHSDVVMGAVITDSDELAERLRYIANASGGVPGPMDSFLVLRGLKTLHVRLDRHCENATKIARFLKDHPKVGGVLYPGLPEHPGHALANKQMRGYGGMVSFWTTGDTLEEANHIMAGVKLFTLAESLGGVESLIGHPATMTHASIPSAERQKAGLHDSLLRLSIGIEAADDLIADLDNALAGI